MKKMITSSSKKKFITGIALAAVVTVSGVVAAIGGSLAGYWNKYPVENDAVNGIMLHTIENGTSAGETSVIAQLTNGDLTTIDSITVGNLDAATTAYDTTGLVQSDGNAAFYVDATRFKNFAPGHTGVATYKLTNTGNISSNIQLKLKSSMATDASYEDCLDKMAFRIFTKKTGGTWTALADTSALNLFKVEAQVGTGSITLAKDETLEVAVFVHFTSTDAAFIDNTSNDNKYMGGKWNFMLTFDAKQP